MRFAAERRVPLLRGDGGLILKSPDGRNPIDLDVAEADARDIFEGEGTADVNAPEPPGP